MKKIVHIFLTISLCFGISTVIYSSQIELVEMKRVTQEQANNLGLELIGLLSPCPFTCNRKQLISEVRKKIAKGANPNMQDKNGWTPLMLAALRFFDNAEIVPLLIKAKVDLDIQNQYGNSALIKAVEYKRTGMIILLLDAGANRYIKNNDGDTFDFHLKRRPKLLQDLEIQKTLANYEERRKQQKELLLNETPLPLVLIDIISEEYIRAAPPTAEWAVYD